ncbi:MAG: 30S ribosomal protein S2 [Cyanobacteria bacterium P01_A01_bin.135]
MPVVSLAQLLESGVHFGHQTRRWNPKMDSYIYTSRNGVHIIDLVQTAQLMEQAYRFMREATEQGKKVLFVGTKRQAAGIIAQEASRCGAYYVNQRWLGGMLTNWATIKTRVERLKELERREETGALDMLPKKEASMLRRELEKLQKYLGGIKLMRQVPDIVVIVDQRREYNAVQECMKLDIPIVALLDTNCDPDVVDIPIPANDDAIRSIKLIIGRLADAIYEGRHGQLEEDDNDIYQDYEDYEGAEEEYEDPEPVAEVSAEEMVAVEEAVVEEATTEAATVPEAAIEDATAEQQAPAVAEAAVEEAPES